MTKPLSKPPVPEATAIPASGRDAAISAKNALIRQVEQSPLSLGLFTPEGRYITSSQRWHEVIAPTEINRDAMTGSLPLRMPVIQQALAGEVGVTGPLPTFGPDGDARWVRMEIGPWTGEDGQVDYLLAHCWDITSSVETRLQLQRTEQRLTAALSIDRMIVKEFNFRTGETFISGSCPELEAATVLDSTSLDHIHPDDREMLHAVKSRAQHEQAKTGKTREPLRVEYRLNDGKGTWVSTTSQVFADAEGRPERILLVTQDITELMERRREVETLAFVDALTGLPNRARFQREFQQACADSEVSGRPLGLVMVDVDHFKDINDTLGHDAGDALLKALAEEMRKVFRATDLVARLGGDEFAILLRDVGTEADMVRPLTALRAALRAPLQHRGQGFRICTSIGAALHNDPDADPEHLLKNADIALYKAKEAGRDQVILFQPQMRSEVEQRLELLRDVRMAIPRGEFTLFYQPVVNINGRGRVAGFEALMRWNHPDQGVLTPAHFMAAFEDQDLSLQLGEVTIETALKQMRAWIDQDIDFGRVSINLSAAQFRTGRLAADLQARLRHWGVPNERLTVEVTENVYLGWGAEIVAETVRELHDNGVTIALDDFGTGYASLANLRQFPIDRLKIDKSFVQNVEDDAIVRAVINLGASMGMEVVAEGVEKLEQLSALSRYGCEHVQGFHFAKPMPAGEVPGYLRAFTAAIEAGKNAA